jgi:hypothetical protein
VPARPARAASPFFNNKMNVFWPVIVMLTSFSVYVYWNQCNVECATCTHEKATPRFSTDSVANYVLYRYGEFRYVPKSGVATTSELLRIAQTLFADPSISSLHAQTGTKLTDLSDTDKLDSTAFIICLNERDRFMYPALRVGEVTPVRILDQAEASGNRTVYMRTVSVRPRVFEIPNFLSVAECEHLVSLARTSQLEKSKVGGDVPSKGEYRDVRTSTQMWIGSGETRNTPIVDHIRARVFDFTHMPADIAESLQVVHYNITQHYLGHHDYAHKWESTDNPYIQAGWKSVLASARRISDVRPGGNRYITLIFYLNDVKAGGETAFPVRLACVE